MQRDARARRRLSRPPLCECTLEAPAPPQQPPPTEAREAPRRESTLARAVRCGERGDLWGVIGLRAKASPEEVRDALRTTRLATHPDRHRDQEEMATEASKYVAVAARVLGHAGRRAAYVHAGSDLRAYERAAQRAEEEEVARRQRAADAAAERAAKEAARKEQIGRWKEARAAAGTPEGEASGEAERNAARAPSSVAKRKAEKEAQRGKRREAKRARSQEAGQGAREGTEL